MRIWFYFFGYFVSPRMAVRYRRGSGCHGKMSVAERLKIEFTTVTRDNKIVVVTSYCIEP